MATLLNICPGEVWVAFPWDFSQKPEIADSGESLDGTTVPPDINASGSGVTPSAEAISGNKITFTLTIDAAATAGDRTLAAQVGTDGSASTILTDECTVRVRDVLAKSIVEGLNTPNRLYAVKFGPHPVIAAGQVLTGTPTVSWDDATSLTTSEEAVDATNNWVQFRVGIASGATTGTRRAEVTATTTVGSTIKGFVDLVLV
jgi:hypothetical protein